MKITQHTIKAEKGTRVVKDYTRKKAIRLFCIECMGFQVGEVNKCCAPTCPLFPYRSLSSIKDFDYSSKNRPYGGKTCLSAKQLF